MKHRLQFVDIPGRSRPQSISVTDTGRVNVSNYGHLLLPDKAEEYGLALIRAAAIARTVEHNPMRRPASLGRMREQMQDRASRRAV